MVVNTGEHKHAAVILYAVDHAYTGKWAQKIQDKYIHKYNRIIQDEIIFLANENHTKTSSMAVVWGQFKKFWVIFIGMHENDSLY